jgi:GNAT superfamily N-acetyltransferase
MASTERHKRVTYLRVITAADTLPLRNTVLRPDRPLSAAQFHGDELPTTKHFGAFHDGELVGIASLYLAELPERPGEAGLQLRGMATAPEVRGDGFGSALVQACESFARTSGMKLIWCNARTTAVGFYQKLGWMIVSEEFKIPDVGPHFRMSRQLK